MSPALRNLIWFSGAILVVSVGYYLYVLNVHPPSPERETFLSEVGEEVGEIALWAFIAIYVRTVVKIVFGKGPFTRRLLPGYSAPRAGSLIHHAIGFLDRTHVFLGVAAILTTLLHIILVGLHAEIWFFPVVLALIFWQPGVWI